MKTKAILILFISLTISLKLFGQEIELFLGENKLNSCRLDIPLTYKKKHRTEYIKAAKENKDVELVLLRYDKKTKKVKYSTYYIVAIKRENETLVYLETTDNHASDDGQINALFVQFKPKYDRFYTADCFKNVLAENPSLKEKIKKK